MRVQWYRGPGGDRFTERTLAEMRRRTVQATTDPLIVRCARRLIAHLPKDAHAAQATTLLAWVQEHVRYVRDPTTYELLVRPENLIRDIKRQGYAQEDCDSAAMLLAALLEAVGFPTRFRVVSGQPPRAGDSRFSHVFIEALIGGRWVPMDPTVTGSTLGFHPRSRGREAVYEGNRMYMTLGDAQERATPVEPWYQTAAKQVGTGLLPLLERYGVLKPKLGPERLPLPGEPGFHYGAAEVARAVQRTNWTPWLIGGAVGVGALYMLSGSGAGRRRRR